MIEEVRRPSLDDFVTASAAWRRPVVSRGVADDWALEFDAELDRFSGAPVPAARDVVTQRHRHHLAVRQVRGASTVAVVERRRLPRSRRRGLVAGCSTVDELRVATGREPESVRLAAGDVLFVPRGHDVVIEQHDGGWHVAGWWHARGDRRRVMTELIGHVVPRQRTPHRPPWPDAEHLPHHDTGGLG